MSDSVPMTVYQLLSMVLAHFLCGPGWHSQYSDSLHAGLFRVRTLVYARFSAQSRTALGLTQPLIQWVKLPDRGFDHPPPSNAEVKERVELYLYSPSGPSWPVLGWTLPLPYFLGLGQCVDADYSSNMLDLVFSNIADLHITFPDTGMVKPDVYHPPLSIEMPLFVKTCSKTNELSYFKYTCGD
jgi:hypothetical protein